jgi:NAD(P)-dependent dehydrogenase (short-subunit alcohol dehydrogenase family)
VTKAPSFIFRRSQEALDAAVTDLGPNARAVKGSVSDEADLDRLYVAVQSERGTLDIVFANAGAGNFGKPPKQATRCAFWPAPH